MTDNADIARAAAQFQDHFRFGNFGGVITSVTSSMSPKAYSHACNLFVDFADIGQLVAQTAHAQLLIADAHIDDLGSMSTAVFNGTPADKGKGPAK